MYMYVLTACEYLSFLSVMLKDKALSVLKQEINIACQNDSREILRLFRSVASCIETKICKDNNLLLFLIFLTDTD